jgi:phosphate ABC transporter ATP-binding protein
MALKPEVLIMDEPTSMVDVVNARKIEQLITELRRSITIVLVTHNPQQAHEDLRLRGFPLRRQVN